MKARDVMVSPVITVKPYSSVRDVAKLLIEKRISAVPVVGDDGKLAGMISEGDLMHRSETGTERQHSWWLRPIAGESTLASEYIQNHTHKISDLMRRKVITAKPDTPLSEIAVLMERNGIKRVPIMQDGELVGIVSRANLVQAIASAPTGLEVPLADEAIRDKLIAKLQAQPWAHTDRFNVTVHNGVVSFWGIANSETERKALCVAAETTPGVRAVNDYMAPRPLGSGL